MPDDPRDREASKLLIAITIAVLICLPAVYLANRRSSWIVDYFILVFAVNRGVRRVVDYWSGAFDPLSPISLTPLVVGGLATLVVVEAYRTRSSRIGSKSRMMLRWYLVALGYSFAIGIFYNRAAAVYELGNAISPIGLMGMAMVYADRPRVIRRWALSAVAVGVFVAAYGMWQFYTIPPWDAFWVRSVKFEGYLGELKPTKMTLFSTLHERGPAAMFLAGTLILILLRPRILGVLKWPAAALVLVAMLFTYSRTTVIHVALAAVALPVVAKGKGLGVVVVVGLALAFGGNSLLGFLPQQQVVSERYATIGAIQEDGSFQGRIQLLQLGLRLALTQPQGAGLGSHGLGGRVAEGGSSGLADSTGYVEIFRVYGLPGFILIVGVLRQLWLSSSVVLKRDPHDGDAALFRAWFVSGMIVLFSGNWLGGVSYFWVLAGYVLGKADAIEKEESMSAPSEAADEGDWDRSPMLVARGGRVRDLP